MLDLLASIAAPANSSIAAIAGLTVLVLLGIAAALLGRRRRSKPTLRSKGPGGLELEHGTALRENMERMRKDAPFRRRDE